MKLICYSLFNAPCPLFEEIAYVKGFYWNSRMNNLIYPDWRSHLEVDQYTYNKYQELFDWLVENNNLSLKVNDYTPQLCAGMLWRMKPMWIIDVSYILCRDADAITTYKEAQMVQCWIQGGLEIMAIHDNPAHGGLMGGMVGFDCAAIKAWKGWNSFDEMIANRDLSRRGSDQDLLNYDIGSSMGNKIDVFNNDKFLNLSLPQVDNKLWESNLTCRHIGSAGVVDMEVIRFFNRFDEYQWKFDVIERKFPKLFNWH